MKEKFLISFSFFFLGDQTEQKILTWARLEREGIWSGLWLSVCCCERGSHKEGDWSRDICVHNWDWDQPLQPKTVMAVEYTWHRVALFLGSLGIGLPKSLYGPKSGPYSSYEKLCFELSVTVCINKEWQNQQRSKETVNQNSMKKQMKKITWETCLSFFLLKKQTLQNHLPKRSVSGCFLVIIKSLKHFFNIIILRKNFNFFKIYRIKAFLEIFDTQNRHFVFHCMIKKKP